MRDNLRAQHHILVYLFVAQVEEPVFQADILFHLGRGRHLKGQIAAAFSKDGQGIRLDFHCAGGNFIVIGVGAAPHHRAGHRYCALLIHAVQQAFVVYHDLHHAIMIPQVHKQHAAVVPDIFNPAGHANLFIQQGFPDGGTDMGTVRILCHVVSATLRMVFYKAASRV